MRRTLRMFPAAVVAIGALSVGNGHALQLASGQETKKTDSSVSKESQDKAAKDAQDKENASKDTEPKPYDKVITADAKHSPGIFTVHRVHDRAGDKWYFEIPSSQYNKDFLWVTRLTAAPLRTDRAGRNFQTRVVYWERRENKILLREKDYTTVAASSEPIARGVLASDVSPILIAFNVEAWGKDDAAVIDVSKLYTAEIPEISPKGLLNGTSADSARTFLDRISSFPANIEAQTTVTYNIAPDGPKNPGSDAKGDSIGAVTAIVHFSLIKLSEEPVMPRIFDDRVGYFHGDSYDYGRDLQKGIRRMFISRWHLQKKDSTAAVSEPVTPIVFYIDPATPVQWIPYIERAVQEWQPAFEAAGFKNAIYAKAVPNHAQDPDWSEDDIRHSMIRWLPSQYLNAMGVVIADPRSGEILNASVSVYSNVMDLARKWYFLQASPLDPRAQRFPFPDELMGTLVQYVVAHEIGHTLGLTHNFLASSQYPVEKLRDAQWVKTMGHSPSIMDYARFNYVAQPEDHIDPNDLIPRVGPYDKFAVTWGYKPIEAKAPDEEQRTLDEWARQQDKTPWLRYQYQDSDAFDPAVETEAIGDADSVEASTLGIKNLHRVIDNLYPAMTTTSGASYEQLREMWQGLSEQYQREMLTVVRMVGGLNAVNKHAGQAGPVWSVVSASRQKAAMQFVIDNAFRHPAFYNRPELMRLFAIDGGRENTSRWQGNLLDMLLSGGLLVRLEEEQQTYGKDAYSMQTMLHDLRSGVLTEFYGTGPVNIGPMRRDLQIYYVNKLENQLNRVSKYASYVQPLSNSHYATGSIWLDPVYRGELKDAERLLTAAMPRAADAATHAHMDFLKTTIDRALDPKVLFTPEKSGPLGIVPRPESLAVLCADEAFCVGKGPLP